jgi:hypothetical protein
MAYLHVATGKFKKFISFAMTYSRVVQVRRLCTSFSKEECLLKNVERSALFSLVNLIIFIYVVSEMNAVG